MKTLNGALTQADVLGIFGRQGVDLAALWGPGNLTEPWAYAFRMFRNYDGKGSAFGDSSVSAVSDDQEKLAIYASNRSSDKALLLMVINKDPTQNFTSKVSIEGLTHAGNAKVFRYSAEDLHKIVSHPDQAFTKEGFSASFPAYSITLVVIPSK
jgi:alpha-L-arabinofuranosidase